jgi:uncharacterized protein (DUF2336 family)
MSYELTREDVARLLQDPSPETRAALADKVAKKYDVGGLSKEEFDIARDIIEVMAHDAATVVREALAINLKASQNLPREVAKSLARDIDSVALPILEFSTVLEDADLIDLIRTSPEAKQTAIARRETLSTSVTDALVATENRTVVKTVVANNGAEISEKTLNRVVDKFGALEDVNEPLAHRRKLPLTVAERLVTLVSDRLRDHLVTHHELSADTASELVIQARERATVNLVGPSADRGDVERLVAQLHRNGRLSPSIVLRALCMGDIGLFEAAMAQLAGIPVMNARILIHDKGEMAFKALYQKAWLPENLYSTFHTALEIALATDFRGADYDPETYSRTMLERILTQCEGLRNEDAEFLLRKLKDLAPPDMAAA